MSDTMENRIAALERSNRHLKMMLLAGALAGAAFVGVAATPDPAGANDFVVVPVANGQVSNWAVIDRMGTVRNTTAMVPAAPAAPR